ncbi:MAG: hypothetical protein HYZ58_01340 [Acidobacteria bacterium]|nr:hypothetical protein [Acidobacteriota bacterium]MBI3261779.1 hypothetical protein [Acidobacteriota bacterium]
MNQEKTSAAAGGPEPARGSCERIGAEVDRLLRGLAPSEDVRHHFRSARIEVLKGLRGLIDERIQCLSTESQKGTSVPIE